MLMPTQLVLCDMQKYRLYLKRLSAVAVGTGGDHRVHDLEAGLQPARLVTTSLRSHRSQIHQSYNI